MLNVIPWQDRTRRAILKRVRACVRARAFALVGLYMQVIGTFFSKKLFLYGLPRQRYDFLETGEV